MRTFTTPILLLTACVNPGGMAYTTLQDPVVRMDQYVTALRFYIANTNMKIVVCENTSTDLSYLFAKEILDGRLEYLTFDGNNYDNSLGKGYGEALIIRHALVNSQLINGSKGYVIKVTGRIIVENINDLINYVYSRGKNRFCCNITETFFFQSVVMAFHPSYFKGIMDAALSMINDSAMPPRYLENVLAELIGNNKSIIIKPFLAPPLLKGISATYNIPYSNKNPDDNACDNLFLLSKILTKRGQRLRSLACTAQYFMLLAKRKLTK